MPSASDSSAVLRTLVGDRPLIDIRTAAIILVMCAGFPAIGALYLEGAIPALLAVTAGTLLMNLSFTAWHESAHQNFSRSQAVNTIAGWLASFASVYPGYFARRREHLIHHKYEGVEGYDPVYPRVQASFWSFPLHLIGTVFRPSASRVPSTFLALTGPQRVADGISNLLVAVIVISSIPLQIFSAVVYSWILPRLIVYGIHAYYICYFPHHKTDGGFVVLRIHSDRLLLRLITVNQHLHGIHHRWPWIPWHKYRKAMQSLPREIEAMDLVGTSSL